MDTLKQFSIPIGGLGNKLYRYDFQVDSNFFTHFTESVVQEGRFDVTLELDKRSNMMEMGFLISGTYPTECDRCLAKIDLPIKDKHHLIAKYSEAAENDAEVIHVSPQAHEFNVAKYVHEFICLSIPIVKSYNCEEDPNPPCDFKMLGYLSEDTKEGQTDEETDYNNPFRDALKGLKDDNGGDE